MELPSSINSNFKTYSSDTASTYENSFRTSTTVNAEEKLSDRIDEYPDGEGGETSTEKSIKTDTTIKRTVDVIDVYPDVKEIEDSLENERIVDVIDEHPDVKWRENSRENERLVDVNDGYPDVKGREKSLENERTVDVIGGYQDVKGKENSLENSVKTDTNGDEESGGINEYPPAKEYENINKETTNNKQLSNNDRKNTKKIQTGMNNDKRSPYTDYMMHKYLTDIGPELSAKQRAQLVQKRCKAFMKENNIQFDHNRHNKYDKDAHMISRRYNLSLCYNCKVASTNTKRIIYALDNEFAGDINTIKRSAARAYSKSRRRPFKEMLSGVYSTVSVMFVREPIERLLSAYRDQRSYPEYFKSGSFTFKDYLELVLDDKIEDMNKHVYPYFEKCRPCEIQYDFVVLQKNFNEDMDVILKQVNAYGKIGIPERKKTGYHTSDSEKLVKKYFKKVPNETIHQLWKKYYKDYYIFGFPYPSHLMD